MTLPFPDKKYSIIYADPPWSYNDAGCNGAAEKVYGTMSLQDICDLPVKDIAAKDCILFIWVTYPLLPEGLDVIKSWGFEYKSIAFQWIKVNAEDGKFFYGLGRWTRGNTEPCLIATRGKPKRVNNSVSLIVKTKIRGHSQKPKEVRERIIHLVGDLPRIELFSRDNIEGWDSWGNEVPNTKQKELKT
jgi:N6-adenosine-specific RNA methylase IME4